VLVGNVWYETLLLCVLVVELNKKQRIVIDFPSSERN